MTLRAWLNPYQLIGTPCNHIGSRRDSQEPLAAVEAGTANHHWYSMNMLQLLGYRRATDVQRCSKIDCWFWSWKNVFLHFAMRYWRCIMNNLTALQNATPYSGKLISLDGPTFMRVSEKYWSCLHISCPSIQSGILFMRYWSIIVFQMRRAFL